MCLLAAAVACACKSSSLLQLSRHNVPYQKNHAMSNESKGELAERLRRRSL